MAQQASNEPARTREPARRERLEPPAVSPLERSLLVAGPGSSSAQRPGIGPVGASSVLSKVKQFLPQLQQANQELQQRMQMCDPAELDIEHIPQQADGSSEGQIIQMDLACGILDLHDDAALAAAQRAIAAGGEIAVEAYDGGISSGSRDDDSDDSSSSSGSEDEACGAAAGSSGRSDAGAGGAGGSDRGGSSAQAMQVDGSLGRGQAASGSPGGGGQQSGRRRRVKPKPRRPVIEEV